MTVPLTSSCQPLEPTVKACDLSVDKPHVSSGLKKKGILGVDAKVRVECDVAPESHIVTIQLKREVSHRWVVLETVEDSRLPRPGKRETYQINYAGCVPGAWRAIAQARGSLRGKAFNFAAESDASIGKEECTL
ncbi:hypothetical protein [Herbihabitans rhizosphaerae]|uniref:hypothetical protein n=1 Tax=Herbihabitans rhizosphaerae TaxID=1872711 RepID=UPI00102D0092|nr:hypothetical protein [Herbihabitans rhizosphaerae]